MNRRAENARRNFTKHGMSNSLTHKSWMLMRRRCNNPNRKTYRLYGGRGIEVCKRWDNYILFLSDMGERPGLNFTLERKDTNRSYEPGNCIWAEMKAQNRNRRNNRILVFGGKSLCLAEWAEQFKIPYSRLHARLKLGWSIKEALQTPKLKNQFT